VLDFTSSFRRWFTTSTTKFALLLRRWSSF